MKSGESTPSNVFGGVAEGILAYLAVHSPDGAGARRAVLEDVLAFIQERRGLPGLDERGHATIDALEAHINQELGRRGLGDAGGRIPDAAIGLSTRNEGPSRLPS